MVTTVPLLEVRQVHKSFGHVHALRGVNFSVNRGEIVALLGDNGAGKSTLTKMIAGSYGADLGDILFEGKKVSIGSTVAARALGIEIVYQDLALAPDMDAAANLFLGREVVRPGVLGWIGVLDRPTMRFRSKEAFRSLGVTARSHGAPVAALSGGQRQGVAVARAALWAKKIIIMDEPTAALGVVQTKAVLDLAKRVRDAGVSVVFISHNLPDVFKIADRCEVLRLGRRVARFNCKSCSMEDVVAAMTGAVAHE
jgi:simple sugar transport system ATP-binding protein